MFLSGVWSTTGTSDRSILFMKKWIIYCHKNKINGKSYIGQTSQKTYQRWGKSGKQYRLQSKFYNAIKKYGWDNFEHVILEENIESLEKANEREIYWISCYNSVKAGYNCSFGGGGIKGVPCSEDNKIKMSIQRKGSGNPMFGRHPKSEFKKGVPNVRMSKKVLQYDLNGNFIKEWPSIAEASRFLKTSNQNIVKVCQGKRNKCAGYIWRYKTQH